MTDGLRNRRATDKAAYRIILPLLCIIAILVWLLANT